MVEEKIKLPLIRVMLVDDDELFLEDIQKLVDWNELGFEIIAVFTNGEVALNRINTCKPDFIITDIRMPCMDGLSFAAEVGKAMPHVQMLLLTAYADFDYAKKAISLGISNYLLKYEISKSTLTGALLEIRHRLNKSKSNVALSCQQGLEQFLNNPEDSVKKQGLSEKLSELSVSSFGVMIIIPQVGMIIKDSLELSSTLSRECYCIRDEILDIFMEGKGAKYIENKIFAAVYGGKEVVALTSLGDEVSGSSNQHKLYDISVTLQKTIAKTRNNPPTILYLPYSFNNLDKLYDDFLKVDKICGYTIFYGNGRVIDYYDLRSKVVEEALTLDEYTYNKMRIKEITVKENLELINEMFDKFCRKEYSISGFRQILNLIDGIILQYRSANLCSDEHVHLYWEKISRCCFAEQVWEVFYEFCEEIMRNDDKGYSSRINKTLQFIHTNYGEDISIQDIADELGLNSEYLNKLFKKEVGQGFSRYLTGYRMDQARKLLESEKYNVGEVAKMVGYKSSQYFSVTFRQVMGVSPSALGKQSEN